MFMCKTQEGSEVRDAREARKAKEVREETSTFSSRYGAGVRVALKPCVSEVE
jgi:hypothetical protein